MRPMADPEIDSELEAVREAAQVRVLRARRDNALTPSERLEHVHELCRQLSAIRPVVTTER